MTLYPNAAQLWLAGLVKTALINSVLKLYQAISQPLSQSTVIADFTEADFDGYAAKTITAWLAAYIDPDGGGSIQSGTQQWNCVPAGPPPVANSILGWYLVSATGTLVAAGDFPAPIAMSNLGDAIPLNITLNYGR